MKFKVIKVSGFKFYNKFLNENGEFVVFGDPKQNIYNREIDSNGDIRIGVIGGEFGIDN